MSSFSACLKRSWIEAEEAPAEEDAITLEKKASLQTRVIATPFPYISHLKKKGVEGIQQHWNLHFTYSLHLDWTKPLPTMYKMTI